MEATASKEVECPQPANPKDRGEGSEDWWWGEVEARTPMARESGTTRSSHVAEEPPSELRDIAAIPAFGGPRSFSARSINMMGEPRCPRSRQGRWRRSIQGSGYGAVREGARKVIFPPR